MNDPLSMAHSDEKCNKYTREAGKLIPIIDTHQHLWDLSQMSLPWTKNLELMNRSYLMSDYLRDSDGMGIIGSVYMEVNVTPEQRLTEIDQITSHCVSSSNPMKALVISGDPDSNQFNEYLDSVSGNSFIKGLRCVLHMDEREKGSCLRKDFVSGVKELGRRGLLFSICIRPSELDDAVDLAKQCPETVFVLDHCGNADPNIINGESIGREETWGPLYTHTKSGWEDSIGELSSLDNVICKISGIVARSEKGWEADDLAPTINHCLDSFGSERVIFGSDWPVCLFGSDLKGWVTAYRHILSERDTDFQHNAMHGTAERVYKLEG